MFDVYFTFAQKSSDDSEATGTIGPRRLPKAFHSGLSEFRATGLSTPRNSRRRQSLDELRALRSNRLEALKGDRAGQFSIRINQQWRIRFEWPRGARD